MDRNTSRLALALVAAATLILAAPFLGEIRRALRSASPAQYLLVLASVLGLLILTAVAAALSRIRERRAMRLGAIAAALLFGLVYSIWTATPDPEVNAVERFHFVQYGLVTFLFYRVWRPRDDGSVFVLPVLAALLVATVEEWFQWFIPARVGEMRDVFLNAAAIISGLLFSVGVNPPARLSLTLNPGSARRILQLAAVVVVAFAGFVHSVHLGHAVSDPEAGTFNSRYDGSTLLALARDRQVRWKTNPPLQRPPRLSREDQYMSEGLLHVQERNRRWDAGDFVSSWQENLILERFYAPVLDTPSYVSASGHRWPDRQREDAYARVTQDGGPAPYVSRADDGFVRTWRRPVFWAVVGMVLAAIGVVAVMVDRRVAV